MFTPPTLGERLAWAGFYAWAVVAGLYIIIYPPIRLGEPTGPWLTILWGLLLVSAVVPMVASLNGKFKWEYAALPLVIAGVAAYAAKVWYFTWFNPTDGAKAALLTALTLGLWRRWLDRRALVKQDEAHQDQQAEG
jgi:predicted membrane channel-forming protein YqfA (hemolysin III family)